MKLKMKKIDKKKLWFVCSESALIERKRRKRKLEKEIPKNGSPAECSNQGSIEGEEKTPLSCIKITNAESSIEKVIISVSKLFLAFLNLLINT
jgi:hypothetical protein